MVADTDYHKSYYKMNKDKMKSQIRQVQTKTLTCEICGCNFQKQWKKKHLLTKKCSNMAEQIQNIMNKKNQIIQISN